jgi:hypothetical protein
MPTNFPGILPSVGFRAPAKPAPPAVSGPATPGLIGTLLQRTRAIMAATPARTPHPGAVATGQVAIARDTPASLLANAPLNTPEKRSADAAAAAQAAGRARANAKGYGF